LLEEAEQQPEGVAVTVHRLLAGAPVGQHVIGEEVLQ